MDLLEKSPAIVTPNFLDIMISDEAIVEDVYNLMSDTENSRIDNLPLKNYTVFDIKGSIIARKGELQVSDAELRSIIAKKRETILKMPTSKDKSLFMGMRIQDRIFFFKIDEARNGIPKKKICFAGYSGQGRETVQRCRHPHLRPEGNAFYSQGR